MSTQEYLNPVDGKRYEIGTIGWEGLQLGWDISRYIQTYGLWAGPGWCGGRLVPKGTPVAWGVRACV